MSARRRIARALLLAAILAHAGLIFWFSAQTGEESGAASSGVVDFLMRLFVRGYGAFTEAQKQPYRDAFGLIVRKAAHFSEFALLSLLIAAWLRLGEKRFLLPAWGLSTLYACTDEVHQMFVDGRGPALTDVCIDSLGALAGAAAVLAALRIRARKKTE